ncbi:AMP-binding protein [Streptomyces sp. NPDC053755]|uniref:AMP-binding protein n=1 Tax=Streptomyces sp. NPDC053755 TaxID=3155815 RepID=UPI0034271709
MTYPPATTTATGPAPATTTGPAPATAAATGPAAPAAASPAPAAADSSATAAFRHARDTLLAHREDLDAAHAAFRWPELTQFNWALDWFDVIARDNPRPALHLIGPGGPQTDRILTYAQLAARSDQVAAWLREQGVRRGEAVLLALSNREAVWETMLAAIKLGAVVIPTYTTATPAELADRITRGQVRHVIAEAAITGRFTPAGRWTAISVGGAVEGWLDYDDSHRTPARFTPDGPTDADAPLFRYFTSGTTSAPKMVEHTHTSYPVGHLSGMYWNGVTPGDLHLNISLPGWAKHAWSSFFVPFNAEATVLALPAQDATAPRILDVLRTRRPTTFCAPPTVWRGLLAAGLGSAPPGLREAVSAGEPLDAELIETVRERWGIELRDGFGQTETTAQIGTTPGARAVPGRMGRPLPGYRVVLLDPDTGRPVPDGRPGELCLDLAGDRPAGVMRGYSGDPQRTARAFAGGLYRTGDLALRHQDGSLSYLSRADDMFKSFDHRISPLELEQVLLRQPAVADAAVVPVPDPVGMWVPKAYVVPAAGFDPGPLTAELLLEAADAELPPEKRVRVLEFAPALPRTASGKVRRAALKEQRPGQEFTAAPPA